MRYSKKVQEQALRNMMSKSSMGIPALSEKLRITEVTLRRWKAQAEIEAKAASPGFQKRRQRIKDARKILNGVETADAVVPSADKEKEVRTAVQRKRQQNLADLQVAGGTIIQFIRYARTIEEVKASTDALQQVVFLYEHSEEAKSTKTEAGGESRS